jgi:hypothetical protein
MWEKDGEGGQTDSIFVRGRQSEVALREVL